MMPDTEDDYTLGIINNLKYIINANRDKRVVVVGTTCTGKSTLLSKISSSIDMDESVFPKLSKQEREYVCQTPWTEEIGIIMNKLTKERVKVEAGKPVFGTVVLDSDLIIYLKISEYLLQQRCAARKINYEDAKNMGNVIEREVKNSGIRHINFCVG